MANYFSPPRTIVGGVELNSSGTVVSTQPNRSWYPFFIDSKNTSGPPYTIHTNWGMVKQSQSAARFTGHFRDSSGNVTFRCRNWDMGLPGDNPLFHYTNLHSWIGELRQAWINTALARSDPSAPKILLPTFAWELREFPRMLRDLGRVLEKGIRLSDIPGAHLAWQFGWAPLYSDLVTLVDLAFEIEKTQSRFAKASQRLKLGGTIVDSKDTRSYQAVAIVGHVRKVVYETHERVWFTAHWNRSSDVPQLSLSQSQRLRDALGLNRPIASIWAALPWSFLIDYFIGVSNYLEASGGLAQFRPSQICIMQHSTVRLLEDTYNLRPGFAEGTFTPTKLFAERKKRYVVSDPSPRLAWSVNPISSKIGILSSLATALALRKEGL